MGGRCSYLAFSAIFELTLNCLYMNKAFHRSVLSLFCIAAVSFIMSCKTAGSQPDNMNKDTMAMKPDSSASMFDHLLVDNRKDPSCGMPVTAGIGDTAHYKDNVLGFCSKECKDNFLKSPEALIAAADLKPKK